MDKVKPVKQNAAGEWILCAPEEATMLYIYMPGPSELLQIPIMMKGARKGTSNWTWNGSVDKPTLKPSILTTWQGYRCHSWLTDGMVKFLPDSTHELAGTIVELLPIAECKYLK